MYLLCSDAKVGDETWSRSVRKRESARIFGVVMSQPKSQSPTWSHRNAPQSVLEQHLRRSHLVKASWVNERRDDLRSAHHKEHADGHADHRIDDELH